jgi:hypothetical protein
MSAISKRVFSNFKGRMAEKTTAIPFAVQKVEMASDNIARVVINVPDVFQRSLNNAELASSVEKAIKGARYLDNSLSATDKANIYTLFVSGTNKVMSTEDASTKPMKEVATNVFRDEDDNIWNHIEDETGSYFVAQDVENLEELILGVRARSGAIATASLEVATSESFSAGMPLMAYSPAKSRHIFGIAIDEAQAYFPATDEIASVNPSYVVATYDIENAAAAPRINITKKDMKQRLLDYMRALYGQNSTFYKRMESLIREHLKTA